MTSIRSVRQGQGMSMKDSRHRELTIGQAGKKDLQSSRLQRIIETSESNSGYPANTGGSGNEGTDSKDG